MVAVFVFMVSACLFTGSTWGPQRPAVESDYSYGECTADSMTLGSYREAGCESRPVGLGAENIQYHACVVSSLAAVPAMELDDEESFVDLTTGCAE
jgi:hypothetical protein